MDAIFHACRIQGATLTSKELAKVTGMPLPSLTEACKKMGAWVEERTCMSIRADDLLNRSCDRVMVGGLSWQNAGTSVRTGLGRWPFKARLR